jgi:ferredoxin
LGLAEEACDGCGLCAPACPEQAIAVDIGSPLYSLADQDRAFVACEQAQASTAKGVLPCLNALGARDLARLYRDGIRQLFISRGRCEECALGCTTTFAGAVGNVNRLLADRALPLITVILCDAAQWRSEVQRARQPSRRALFSGLRQPELLETAEAEHHSPAAALLPGRKDGGLVQWRPAIEPSLCDGCDACAQICPHHVISLVREQRDAFGYAINGQRCTNCGLCAGICARNAVTVIAWPNRSTDRIELHERRCKACGCQYHFPASGKSVGEYCPACSQSERHYKLFQVLKL